jgi:CHAT domain-containing protein
VLHLVAAYYMQLVSRRGLKWSIICNNIILLHAQQQQSKKPYYFNMLAVNQALEHPRVKIETLQSHCLQHNLPCVFMDAEKGTPELVIEALASQEHTWLHMSCHGVQNDDTLLGINFQLHKGDLHLADILCLNLPNAVFTSLIACHTAAGAKYVPNEAMHLAGSMQFYGF